MDFGEIPPSQRFDIALSIAFSYDEWIRENISGSHQYPSLERVAEKIKEEVKPLIKHLFQETINFTELNFDLPQAPLARK